MLDNSTTVTRMAVRQHFIDSLVETLSADESYLAAWLDGSIARDDDDALSDVDLRVVVSDAAAVTLCARPRELAGYTTPERLALFGRFGQPVLIHENGHNASPGESFTCVIYASLLTVDWVLIPHAVAARQPDTRLLVDKVGIPLQPPPPSLSDAQRAERASERAAFFWMMVSIAVKYLLRDDAVRVHHLLAGLEPLVREVRTLSTGMPVPYTTKSSFRLAATVDEQVAVVRDMCANMLSLSPAIVALGGYVPDDPMAIIDGLLSLGPVRD